MKPNVSGMSVDEYIENEKFEGQNGATRFKYISSIRAEC